MDYLLSKAKAFSKEGDHIQALMVLEELISVHKEAKDSCLLHLEQGKVFMKLARRTENNDVKFAYVLGSVACVSEDILQIGFCAHGLYELARASGSVFYCKKFLEKAEKAMLFTQPQDTDGDDERLKLEQLKENWKGLEILIKSVKVKIAEAKISPFKKYEPVVLDSVVLESKESPKPVNNEKEGALRKFWLGLDIKIRRDFMKVDTAKLFSFTKGVNKTEGLKALQEILTSAKEDRKWTFRMCRTPCSKKFSSAEECRNHLEQEHDADFKPSPKEHMVKRIGKDWARKISPGAWEPVDAVAAVERIMDPLANAETFKSNSGWSKNWPLVVDEERSKLLKEVKSLLVSIRDHKVLSSSIRNWLISFPVRHLARYEISEETFDAFHLSKTPQSICFLECHDLIHIRDFLENVKCERDDGTDLVCRAVDNFLDRTRVKEKIDFDPEFSFLLLDKRLLKSFDASFDDEGTIDLCDPELHYAKAPAQGDYIISWLLDYGSVDKIFPRPIREHNLDIWLAVLRAVQFTCRILGTKYANKVYVLGYEAALTVVENFCKSEDERRRDLQEEQWNRYASLLCNRCEERVTENSVSSISLLSAVRDVLEGASHPTIAFSNSEDCMCRIHERKSCSDDLVLNSIYHLKSVVTQQVLLMDSKILLIDNTRIRLLDNLTRLSVFDNRTYMLRVLKPFLLNEIIKMEGEAKSNAAYAVFSLKEEKKPQSGKKNKQNKNSKRTSTSMSRPIDKIVAHKPSVTVEPEGTSPSLETSATTDNEEEATIVDHDMENMLGEDSLPESLESALGGAATIYNSAFDMTLKALLNIKVLKEDLKHNGQPFHEDQVPCALQKFFTSFSSGEIKEEGNYSVLLSDLLASLKEVSPMSSDAAEVLVDILDFWQCWKNPEGESLVTRLFTFEENERMSCTKCRRESNDSEKSAYAIVMAANSIRELKCAFGNMKFVDILKLIRMENKMVCDKKTEGCGKKNFVHHSISKCPPIFTIVLEWEKSETEEEISLEWEIDISRLYEGIEPNTKYRLVSMVGCGEEDEHMCLAYGTNRWANLRRESFEGEVVGDLKDVVKFCEGRKIRPVILLYEAA